VSSSLDDVSPEDSLARAEVIDSVKSSLEGLAESKMPPKNMGGSQHDSFSFLSPSKIIPIIGKRTATTQTKDKELKGLQRDINHFFSEVDMCTEFTLITMCCISAMLAFSEILGDRTTFSKA
jgi:hypothetical protein